MEASEFPEIKKQLIEYHLNHSNLITARNVLNNNSEIFTQAYKDYMDIKIQLIEDNRGIHELTTVELSTIQNLALGNPREDATINAQMLLQMLGQGVYIPYIDPIGAVAGKRAFVPDDLEQLVELVNFSPNPANEFISIQSNLEQEGFINVYNVNGQEMTNLKINEGQMVSELDLFDWADGIYFYHVISENVMIQTGKFTVHH